MDEGQKQYMDHIKNCEDLKKPHIWITISSWVKQGPDVTV